MSPGNMETINKTTKKAWCDNWENIDISTILGIFEYPRVKKLLDIVISNLSGKRRLLEAGCGLGPWVIKLGELGYDISGIDYQAKCISKIKAYDKRQKVYTADVRQIPFGDNSFDAYLSFGVIEHFAEGPDRALREAHRVLKANGTLVVSVPHKNIFVKLKWPINTLKQSTLVRRFFKKGKKTYYYQKYFKVSELENLVANYGFLIEKVMPIDHIFSLVEFSGIFRNKASYDGENNLAVILGSILERIFPWLSAGSILVIASKEQQNDL